MLFDKDNIKTLKDVYGLDIARTTEEDDKAYQVRLLEQFAAMNPWKRIAAQQALETIMTLDRIEEHVPKRWALGVSVQPTVL